MTQPPITQDATHLELYTLLQDLQSHIKLPRLRFHLTPTTDLDIFYLHELNTLQLHYKTRRVKSIYLGCINPDGTFVSHSHYRGIPFEDHQSIENLLNQLKKTPISTILFCGQHSGICPLCDKPLLSPSQLSLGMGPRCYEILTISRATADDI